jgi:nucleotide-binding universal stress UspA family protein
MFERIVVPLDGSLRAEQALPLVARIARHTSGAVHLIQVISPSIDYSAGLAPTHLLTRQMNDAEKDAASSYLKSIAVQQLAGITTTIEVGFGVPALCILAAAARQHSDLIVVCRHGRTGFVRRALGSVAHTLAHESTVPTLILREHDAPVGFADSGTMQSCRALVPLDGSQLAEAALAPAAYLVTSLAAPAPGMVHLAQVVTPVPDAVVRGEESTHGDEVRVRARIYLAQVAERLQTTLKELQLSISWSVACDHDVASALMNLAEHVGEETAVGKRGHYDLIALCTHGWHGPFRRVIGSVTNRMLNTTKLPLLIVRPPAAP